MWIKIQKIEPNPFREELGELNEEQIQKIMESCKMSGYGKRHHFDVRVVKEKEGRERYQLVYGHHRLEAFKRFYGPEHEVDIERKKFNDEKMFSELCRENLIKENNAITTEKIVFAMRSHLEKFPTRLGTSRQGKRRDLGENHIGADEVAKALSKEGMTISGEKVRQILLMENLAPELRAKVDDSHNLPNKNTSDVLPLKIAQGIATLEHDEQRAVVRALNKSSEQKVAGQTKILSKYKSAPEDQKEAVRKGDMDIADVGMASGDLDLKNTKQELAMIDDVLNQVARDLNLATSRLTDSVLENAPLASPKSQESVLCARRKFSERLNEISKKFSDYGTQE